MVPVVLRGVVDSYDADRGLGEVTSSGGSGGTYRFHCTAIADGSRLIDAGSPVDFVCVPGLGGVIEARSVTPID